MYFCRRSSPLVQRSGYVGHTHLRLEGNWDLRSAQIQAILTEAVDSAARPHWRQALKAGDAIAHRGEMALVVSPTRAESQDHQYDLVLRQRLVSRFLSRYSGHDQLTGLHRFRLREPGEGDFLDQIGGGLGLELSCSRSGCRLTWQSFCLIVGISLPTFYRYLSYVTDIYPKSCTSRYCVKLTSSGKCGIMKTAQRRQIWPSDTQRN